MPDIEYFSRRSAEERRAAEQTSDPRMAATHAKLADQYDAVIAAFAQVGQASSARV
jgi:hypothetical protein